MTNSIISVLNHKGGVGKTTTVANVGGGLHRLGKRVLLVDLDPQANLTLHLLGGVRPGQPTIFGALTGRYGLPVVSLSAGFDMVVSSIDLSGVELILQSEPGREKILFELIRPFVGDYDFIIIDCPPSLGLLTVLALSASTSVIIPVEAGTFAMVGMSQLFEIIDKVKTRLNDRLTSYNILLTKYDGRKTIQKEIAALIRKQCNSKVFRSVIRTNVALKEATMARKCVYDLDLKCSGSVDYLSLCNEILSNNL